MSSEGRQGTNIFESVVPKKKGGDGNDSTLFFLAKLYSPASYKSMEEDLRKQTKDIS